MMGEIVSPEVDIFVLSALGCVMLIARPLYCVDFSAIWQDPEKSIFWAEGSSVFDYIFSRGRSGPTRDGRAVGFSFSAFQISRPAADAAHSP